MFISVRLLGILVEILLFDGLLAMLPTEHANQIFEYSSLLINTNIRDIAMLRSQVFAIHHRDFASKNVIAISLIARP